MKAEDWIPITARYPSSNTDVLLAGEGRIGIGDRKFSYRDNKFEWSIQGTTYFEPTHWQYMVAPKTTPPEGYAHVPEHIPHLND